MHWAVLIWVAATFILGYWSITRAKKNLIPTLRRLPALEMFEPAIKRCAEMGRPVMMCCNVTNDATGMQILSMVPFVARIAAAQGTPVHYVDWTPQTVPYVEDAIEVSCKEIGKPEEIARQKVYCWGADQSSVCAEWIRFSSEQKPACSIIFTASGTSVTFIEGSKNVEGNMILGGTTDLTHVGWFVCMSDYYVMPDEELMMAAYINKDPIQLNTLLIYDVTRVAFFILIPLLVALFWGFKVNIIQLTTA